MKSSNHFALGILTLLAAGSGLRAQNPANTPQTQPGVPWTQRVPFADHLPFVQRAPRAEAVAPAASPVQTLEQAAQGQAVPLRSGDTVDLRIASVPPDDQQQWDAPYTIDEAGMLNLPFVGNIKAGGLAPSQVQVAIQNKLISDGIYTNPTVTVNPPNGMRFVSVGGAVRAPGRVPYTSDLTLMSTINAAGGKSDFAGDKIRLTRGGKVLIFSLKKLRKDPSLDPRIAPGDQIEIVESWW